MRAITNKQQQWLWFAVLWWGGLLTTMLLAYLVRWMVSIN
jgi:hypothetical protein